LEQQSGESFSSQLKASTAFSKRVPFTFLIHAVLILVIVIALHWMRRGIRKLAEQKPNLQRALPILDLPIFNRFRDFLRHQPIEPCTSSELNSGNHCNRSANSDRNHSSTAGPISLPDAPCSYRSRIN